MNIVKVRNPFNELERELENWIGDFSGPFGREWVESREFNPAIDVIEEGESFVVRADLPGMDKKDVEITLSDRILSIKGEKKGKSEDQDKRYLRRETWYGSFERRIALPETADAEGIKAEMKDGVLTVSVKKREETKPRQIAIND